MARIIADFGRQRTVVGDFYILEMDCGCEIRVDERALLALRLSRSHLTEFMARAARVAEAHDCDIVVHQVSGERRREVAARQRYSANMTLEPPIQYMGVPVIPDPMLGARDWLLRWGIDPAPRPERSRGQPERSLVTAPREAPEQVVRNAIASPAEFNHQNPMGFQPGPKKTQEDQPRPDRFDLIELD